MSVPAPSGVAITVGGTDVTDAVIWDRVRFSTQMNAEAGDFEMTLRDLDHSLSFTTGADVTLAIDGVTMFGGWLTEVSNTYALSADYITNAGTYEKRFWILRGVDYNVVFDKRVLRNTSDYLHQPPNAAGSTMDGDYFQTGMSTYFDLSDFTFTDATIENVHTISANGTHPYAWPQQGSKLRDLFDITAKRYGALFYAGADKAIYYKAFESVFSRWGFSDVPNNASITAASGFQDAYYGFRDVEAVEDGSVIVNDAMVWGGSEFAGTSGGTVFARVTDATSITDHGRWQLGEVHFGEEGYGIQDGVDARADAIVNGPPGADTLNQQKGLRYPQWNFRFTWYAHQVPKISGTPDHLIVGQLVTLDLEVFGVLKVLPLRRLSISFPQVPGITDETYVQFDGEFSLNYQDPWTLWSAILKAQRKTVREIMSVTTDDSTSTVFGAYGRFSSSITPTPNGSHQDFALPFGYIPGTLEVYVSGLIQTPDTDYTETNNEAGTFHMAVAPAAGTLYVKCRTLST